MYNKHTYTHNTGSATVCQAEGRSLRFLNSKVIELKSGRSPFYIYFICFSEQEKYNISLNPISSSARAFLFISTTHSASLHTPFPLTLGSPLLGLLAAGCWLLLGWG
ncbi:uncharacterized protein BO72DRAFT_145370 [Aspergillus fijiensis CBS 313.89]|uniref:Uncharacterized protein n=1 Tax=Aspergillus fijiensis CBS 313.89 TaxID=1448319 RepID=A0A8G1RN68_9EURO|nr:uncharacterized protein BO72DRAFT_145370 [Aspergillus fijiensis CBS 313.89]RAK76284.1 hypothetical protein BO72DRAFT_145370 [Aspergillus fijiensis CBS 313.89]